MARRRRRRRGIIGTLLGEIFKGITSSKDYRRPILGVKTNNKPWRRKRY